MQRRSIIIFLVSVSIAVNVSAQLSQDVLAYIATYKNIAMSEMKRTGVPAAIKLAQGIHETEAGKSDLVKRSNNHFGIKCKNTWLGDKVFHDDDANGECFRSYTKAEDSYKDHSDFLSKGQRYTFLFNLDPTDYEGWSYGLKKAGYATNIRYSQILIRIIKEYNLQDYTLIAMGRMNEPDHMLAFKVPGLPSLSPVSATINQESRKEIIVKPAYPTGEFAINNTKVIYAEANTAWLSVAEKYNIPLKRLWDFNDLEKDDDVLMSGQLIYLQLKRKVGTAEFHVWQSGESLYDVCQSEGIRYESLLALNHLSGGMQPAIGEKLFLQHMAPARPLLTNDQKNNIQSGNAFTSTSANANNPAGAADHTSSTLISRQPEYTTHRVTTKETLFSISRKYGVDIEKIREWNRLDHMHLHIGQSLIIYVNN